MQSNFDDGEMVNVKAGAKFIGVSPVTLQRIMKRGEIGFFKIGCRIVFSREKHLIPFLLKNEVSPGKAGLEMDDLAKQSTTKSMEAGWSARPLQTNVPSQG